MDRIVVYRDQIPFESDILYDGRFALEALGLLALDILGASAQFGGLACTETSPQSMAVKVGPGRIYQFGDLEYTPVGVLAATGGLAADNAADHRILHQGIRRDATTFSTPAPATVGHSIAYLIQGACNAGVDDPLISGSFYNAANPLAPLTKSVSPFRRDTVVISVKAGASATTGTQVTPTVDAGYIPLYVVTVPYGATVVTNAMIADHPSSPNISVGGGGGGGTPLPTWSSYTFANNNSVLAKRSWNFVNTAGGVTTLKAPATPAFGDDFRVMGNFATNNLIVDRNGSQMVDNTGAPSSTNMTMNLNFMDVTFLYNGTMWTVGTP